MEDLNSTFGPDFISYGLASLLYFGLLIFALFGWRKRFTGRLLLISSIISLAWSVVIVSQSIWGVPEFSTRYLCEVLRNSAWLLLLLRMLGINFSQLKNSPFSTLSLLSFFCGSLIALQILLAWGHRFLLPSYQANSLLSGHVLVALMGLVLIEQILRNTREQRQYQIKFMCLGIGIIFCYDFFMYADALLFKKINPSLWSARGAINAIAVPFIIIASLRNRHAPMKVNLSRDFVFYSSMSLFAGVYLLIMGATGYFIQFAGGNWSTTFQIVFFTAAIIFLLILVFSSKVRAQTRVFLSRHFFSYKYDYRDEWIRITQTLSGIDNEDPLPQRAISVLAHIVGSNGGALWVKENDDAFKHHTSHLMPGPISQLEPVSSEFSQFLMERKWVIDLNELKEDPELYAYLTLPDWLEKLSEAWLIVPLTLSNTLYGFAIINHPMVKISLNWEDHDLIKVAGHQVASELAQQSAMEALGKAREFEAFNQMSAFIVHDFKTIIAQLSLMVKNAEKHKNNPAFIDDMIQTTEHSVQKMSRLLGQLKNKGADQVLRASNISALLKKTISEQSHLKPAPLLNCIDDNLVVNADGEQLSSVFNHILQNARDATPPEGSISVTLSQLDSNALIKIKDSGSGMNQTFIDNELFQPFKSTKGVAGMGIGVFQCKEYISKLGGSISVQSELGVGTEFVIKLPLLKQNTTSSIG